VPTAEHTDHIVLIGPMGVGKTTVGRLVADSLGRPLRDSDTDLGTIHRNARQMAAKQGVEVLHRIEADLLLDALAVDQPLVIAAAASVVDDERCVDALGQPTVTVVWLHAPVATLLPRLLEGDHRRDLGADPERAVADLGGRRDPLYRRVADGDIDVSGQSPADTARAIVDLVEGTEGAESPASPASPANGFDRPAQG
jgi:shikimate kinase